MAAWIPPDLRRDVGFDQNTVHAITNTKLFLERLDVHVGGPQFQGLGHQLIDEADDRRILGGVGQIHVVAARLFIQDLEFIFVVALDAHLLQRVGTDAEIAS